MCTRFIQSHVPRATQTVRFAETRRITDKRRNNNLCSQRKLRQAAGSDTALECKTYQAVHTAMERKIAAVLTLNHFSFPHSAGRFQRPAVMLPSEVWSL